MSKDCVTQNHGRRMSHVLKKVILTLRLRTKITFKKVTFLLGFLVKESLGVQFSRREYLGILMPFIHVGGMNCKDQKISL